VLILGDRWIWDSWIADDGEYFHLFYLQAPRSLGDAGMRHLNADVGHARSTDLVEWEVLPDALGPTTGSWDDLSIWTGSTVQGDDGVWRMYYTATNTRGHGVRDQRLGIAESDDLVSWRKLGESPLLTADPRWYKTLAEDVTASETWRDPQVFRDPGGDGWHMLITARSLTHGRNDDGVLAHARSHDLRAWEQGPPVCESGFGFGQLEVAQVRQIDGRWVLVFTCHPQEMTDERRAATGDYCTWSVPSSSGRGALGPWDIGQARPFTAEPDLFAAPLVQQRDGTWALVGFRNTEPRGELNFHILDPIPVDLDGSGHLVAANALDPDVEMQERRPTSE
jgi:beta-fructofuranosidase